MTLDMKGIGAGSVGKSGKVRHTNKSIVHPLIVMTPRPALVLHRAHSFILKVRPSSTTAVVSHSDKVLRMYTAR